MAAAMLSAAMTAGPVRKATSVVRVDPRTGRLVRKVVVPSRDSSVGPSKPSSPPQTSPQMRDLVEQTAKRYEMDPLLVHSVIQVESNYNPFALSPKGAQGLMQLIPSTARRFGVSNPWDAQQNVEGGVRYLKYLTTLFPNDLRLTIAAYNAGEAAVWKYGNNVPPYPETMAYVDRVGSRYGKARQNVQKSQPDSERQAVAASAIPIAAQDTHAPIEHYVDAAGRLHIRTSSAPESGTP